MSTPSFSKSDLPHGIGIIGMVHADGRSAGIYVQGIDNCVFENVTLNGFGNAVIAKEVNNLNIIKSTFEDCQTGMSFEDCWDSKISDTKISTKNISNMYTVNNITYSHKAIQFLKTYAKTYII